MESLEQAIERAGNPVELLRNSQALSVPFNGRPEFTNWRREQEAWRRSVAVLDQSHHMNDLFVSGPDALRLFSDFGVNSFKNFEPGKAKQFVAVTSEGNYAGDNILFYLDDNLLNIVGQPSAVDWIEFNATTGGYDVEVDRDPPSTFRPGPPKLFRYELQGPLAMKLVERLLGEPAPAVKFFNLARLTVSGVDVTALRHGMAGQPGLEFFGPWEHGEQVLEAILAAGEEFDLHQVGTRAYSTANLESGWMPALVPGFYTDPEMASFRQWLPAQAVGSLGGSYYSHDITDYYVTPYDLGYGKVVAFDHDFFGRDALERRAGEPARQKVTLIWDEADVARAIGSSLVAEGRPTKYIDLPKARYATHQYDTVTVDGEMVGISSDCGYIANERCFVSLAIVDGEHAEPGSRVTVLWGEEPNSTKAGVEPHRLTELEATVAPAPFPAFARTTYRSV